MIVRVRSLIKSVRVIWQGNLAYFTALSKQPQIPVNSCFANSWVIFMDLRINLLNRRMYMEFFYSFQYDLTLYGIPLCLHYIYTLLIFNIN